MLIFLEGPDGSGKTTLLKKFLDDGQICKRGLRGEKPDWDYLKAISTMSNMYDLIIDRCFISDMVYRIVQGGKPEDIDLKHALPYLENSIIIYCTTQNMFENSMQRGEDNITDKETANKISNTYDTVLTLFEKFANVKIIKYNFRDDVAYDNVKTELKQLKGGIKI